MTEQTPKNKYTHKKAKLLNTKKKNYYNNNMQQKRKQTIKEQSSQ